MVVVLTAARLSHGGTGRRVGTRRPRLLVLGPTLEVLVTVHPLEEIEAPGEGLLAGGGSWAPPSVSALLSWTSTDNEGRYGAANGRSADPRESRCDSDLTLTSSSIPPKLQALQPCGAPPRQQSGPLGTPSSTPTGASPIGRPPRAETSPSMRELCQEVRGSGRRSQGGGARRA